MSEITQTVFTDFGPSRRFLYQGAYRSWKVTESHGINFPGKSWNQA